VDYGPARELDGNRTEVLRLLLVLMSKQIYRSPTNVLSQPSLYTAYLVQTAPRRHVLTILCSLLNVIVNSSNTSSFHVPYNHLVWKGENTHESLVSVSLQVLVILLDYQAGSARDKENGPTAKTNMFRYFLAKMHRPADFRFLLDGMLGILSSQIEASNNLLPGSRKQMPYVTELSKWANHQLEEQGISWTLQLSFYGKLLMPIRFVYS
jgi:hypothetical protein